MQTIAHKWQRYSILSQRPHISQHHSSWSLYEKKKQFEKAGLVGYVWNVQQGIVSPWDDNFFLSKSAVLWKIPILVQLLWLIHHTNHRLIFTDFRACTTLKIIFTESHWCYSLWFVMTHFTQSIPITQVQHLMLCNNAAYMQRESVVAVCFVPQQGGGRVYQVQSARARSNIGMWYRNGFSTGVCTTSSNILCVLPDHEFRIPYTLP